MDEKTVDFVTNCKDCIFNVSVNNVQVGCAHGRIPKFVEQNKVSYDGEGYYVIQDVCNLKRNKTWTHYQNKEPQLLALARSESSISVTHIIHTNTEKDGLALLKTIINQNDSKNRAVIIIADYNNAKPQPYLVFNNKLTIRVVVPALIGTKDYATLFDAAARHVKTQYYCTWLTKKKFYKNLVNTVNKMILDKLQYVILAYKEKDSYNGMLVSTLAHNVYSGNVNLPIYDKLKESAEFQGVKHVIHDLS